MAAKRDTRRSAVWEHFLKSEGDQDQPVCLLCNATVKAPDGNTTNLKNHLKRKHSKVVITPENNDDDKQPKKKKQAGGSQQQSLTTMWTKLGSNSKRHNDITLAIAKYIAADLRPLNSINDRGFQELIKTLEPRYEMSSRTHITEKILPAKYKELKAEVKSTLQSASFISLTTDGWTSRATQSFITVTAHVINDNCESQVYVLSTSELEESNNGENLSRQFDVVPQEWDLAKDRISVTTNNAANVCLAMKLSDI
jgi:hypothetical protein